MQNPRTYTKEIEEKVVSAAMNQSTPTQICVLLGLSGIDRANFITDITNTSHPLGRAYNEALKEGLDDVDSILHLSALKGDIDAVICIEKKKEKDYMSELRFNLFGL